MNIETYLELMHFPKEWKEWDMLPEPSVLNKLIASYETGMEEASEHDRHGCFHYWLSKEPDKEILIKLVKLSAIDPDTLMGEYVRKNYLAKAKNADSEVLRMISDLS